MDSTPQLYNFNAQQELLLSIMAGDLAQIVSKELPEDRFTFREGEPYALIAGEEMVNLIKTVLQSAVDTDLSTIIRGLRTEE